jgi:hypothetical protein
MVIILFSGGYYQESSVTWILRWMQYLSPSYYARCALANNQYHDIQINSDLRGDTVLQEKHALGLGLWGSIGALLGMFAIFLVVSQVVFYNNIKKIINKKIKNAV